jgi:hypothetical protein
MTPASAAFLVTATFATAPAQGQPLPVARPQPTYGTADRTTYTVSAWDLEPAADGIVMGITNPILRYISSAPGATGTLYCGVRIPNGAILDFISLFACDDDALTDVVASLYACSDPGGPCTLQGASAGTTGTSGCVSSSSSLGGQTVDNTQSYLLRVESGVGNENRFRSVKIDYRLQVSPDPAIQSFTDVPVAHPFHRFVEALYDAGITAGYPDGRFGVDDPITRGQMAVFLSIALGLHWPN